MIRKLAPTPKSSLLLLLLIGFTGSPHAADKPNFILILTDDQSWVGSSLQIIPGDPRTKSDYFQTPNIERMAAMGMRFTQGYSPAASCCPTRRAIQTGQTPARHEYSQDRKNWTKNYRKQLNIPRMLKAVDEDYQTAHFGKWDHRYDELTPHEQDYDFSDGYTGNFTGGAKNTGGPAAEPDPKRIDSITDKAIHFIERNHARDLPFFLQVSHYAVHLDIFYNQNTLDQYEDSVSPGRKHNMPQFAAMTTDMDAGIGRILGTLIELNLLENTYLIYLSDNGGRNTIPQAPDIIEHRNAPLRDGKHSFYEGGIRVPFIILGPGVEPGSVSTVPVTGLDFLPTMADLVGFKGLPNNIDGGSLKDVLHNKGQGTVDRLNPFLVFHQGVDRKAVSAIRLGDYKLVKTWADNKIELFDLSKDLSEAKNLSTSETRKTKELHSLLNRFLANVGAETRRTED